jgi:HAD superfamily hydrolase (TIGR01509 family)
MQFTTVIFDMDGLLVDSEPLWDEAANFVLADYGIKLSPEQYATTTGLRTKDFLKWWFTHFNVSEANIAETEEAITQKVIELVIKKGKAMPGVPYIMDFFTQRNFKIGLASSSPFSLINTVTHLLKIEKHIQAVCSAAELTYGKPHPQVYLNCAELLNALPRECICFEDSFNGMIAAMAARMKCVLVPEHKNAKDRRLGAADLKIASLQNFNSLLLAAL